MRRDSRTYCEWFEFVGHTLVDNGKPLGVRDMATIFCDDGALLDGRPATATDHEAVAAALTQSLQIFDGCKLISGAIEARYTTNLRLSVPERVAQLTAKGIKVLRLPSGRIEFLFQRMLVGQIELRAWRPFAGAVAVAGTVVGVLILVLLWRSEQAALAGVAVLVGRFWQSRL
jgi:hypothetical protein